MTQCLSLDPAQPDPKVLALAARILWRGGLVAFPTETVYGLGASSQHPGALAALYAAKGRPSQNPLILHIEDVAAARALAASFSPLAEQLAAHFWPGPLTLVVPRAAHVLDAVTAGGPTVALRVPAHPVARALLQHVGIPLAAPSANPSTRLSPTRAEHVLTGLRGRIDLVLDGGPCAVGLESTVVDATGSHPVILRPGVLSRAEIERAAKAVTSIADHNPSLDASSVPRSPGLAGRHYAPRNPLRLVAAAALPAVVASLVAGGERVFVIARGSATALPPGVNVHRLPALPAEYGALLYATLHELDATFAGVLLVELPPFTDAWAAVHDRLARAADP